MNDGFESKEGTQEHDNLFCDMFATTLTVAQLAETKDEG
jgi:hypothetical protein